MLPDRVKIVPAVVVAGVGPDRVAVGETVINLRTRPPGCGCALRAPRVSNASLFRLVCEVLLAKRTGHERQHLMKDTFDKARIVWRLR